MDITDLVAINARRIRERKKLTLDAAASLTGVSRSMLAQIEKGDVNPTISVLWKIANGYKIPFTTLMENKVESVSVIRQINLVPLKEDDGLYINYLIFAFDEDKLFETYRIVIKPKGFLSAKPHLKGTMEYITVFSGQVEISVENENMQLCKGDSIKFNSDVPHSYRNMGKEVAELSMLIYYARV